MNDLLLDLARKSVQTNDAFISGDLTRAQWISRIDAIDDALTTAGFNWDDLLEAGEALQSLTWV